MQSLNQKNKVMADGKELIKAAVKIGTAIVTLAFGRKVGSEGKKNLDKWKTSRSKSNK